MKVFLVLIFLMACNSFAYSQIKYEKEKRIKAQNVPEAALSFVDSMNLPKKIRWYKETGYHQISYEAKTKYKGRKLSIEFSEDGIFEDFEIEITADSILTKSHEKISEYLTEIHDKYSFEKIQIQYLGKPQMILAYFLKPESATDLSINYEIVIATKVDGSFTLFEYLFTESGNFVQRSQIILKMTDNIEY